MTDYSKIDRKVSLIVSKVSKYLTNFDNDFIKTKIFKAYNYSKEAHEWQFRLSWDPYIIHPVEATLLLLELKPDIYTIQACLLHDVIEDTPKSYEDILEIFWWEVAFLCSWMEKLSKVKYLWEERSIWSLRKMFIAMAEDLRVVFIKLADRLHNMKTLSYHPKKDKRTRIAMETLNIYAPIADRLWLYSFKNMLDEECFKILDINSYRKLKNELKSLSKNIFSFIDHAEKEISNNLKWVVSWFEIDYRVKSIYSIYKKMQKKWLDSAKNLYDLFWIRIIVRNIEDCYKVLWIIHNKWKPIPKRFKDYIALPKPNWYKSLHTTIIWLLNDDLKQPTEIQIKTYEMKEYADIWVAAHFDYKENWSKVSRDIDWVKELKELTESLENNDFMTSLKIDVFKDRIFVFTPKWDSINLPSWSTPIDFAYYLHTDIWNHISVAQVNWKVYPLDKELHNWDVIEVVVDKNRKPNPFWLSFVKTTKAKDRIKSFLKKEDKSEHLERWKEIINRYLQKSSLKQLDKDLTLLKDIWLKSKTIIDRESILEQVWNFSINPSALFKRILRSMDLKPINSKANKSKAIKETLSQDSVIEIVIWWEEGLPYKLCSYCCKKDVYDSIVAYINSKWSITIHNRDCKYIEKANKDRLLSAFVKWNEDNYTFITVNFIVQNKMWVLKELTDIIYSMWINIEEISSKKIEYNKILVVLKLELLDHDYMVVDRLLERVKFNLWDKLYSSWLNELW